jgi:hypothetical protein
MRVNSNQLDQWFKTFVDDGRDSARSDSTVPKSLPKSPINLWSRKASSSTKVLPKSSTSSCCDEVSLQLQTTIVESFAEMHDTFYSNSYEEMREALDALENAFAANESATWVLTTMVGHFGFFERQEEKKREEEVARLASQMEEQGRELAAAKKLCEEMSEKLSRSEREHKKAIDDPSFQPSTNQAVKPSHQIPAGINCGWSRQHGCLV